MCEVLPRCVGIGLAQAVVRNLSSDVESLGGGGGSRGLEACEMFFVVM